MRGSDLARSIDMEYRKKRQMEEKLKNNQKKDKKNTSKISENKK